MSAVADMALESEEQVEKIATSAARKAISDLFEIFGVDVTTAEARRSFAEDMSFLRVARVGSSRFRTAAVTALAGSIVTGISYVFYKGAAAIGWVVR